ncbi:2Fe-2S iron-sulfur cluster-binding protein [Streptomyces sp. NPDC093516]|uniref:2Fe-2S iron-sulfur cluster-binding protein n=1 Tax=Streptomyces sp. NPDC093516 TaxID=3155304 RepID=UPI003425353E
MTDDQHGEGTPRSGSRWDPLPQGEYDDGATAFVELPEGGVDALLAADSPLAAPGHGYVPPQITVAPATTAGTDPAATGTWPVPGAPVDGAQWHDPHVAHQQQGRDAGEQPYGTSEAPYGTPYGPGAGAGQHGADDRFTYDPGITGQWTFEEPAATETAPGHDVTGQWSIPVAGGDLPDESGEFTTSSLVEQWGGTPPATLPGGAPAPWATQAAGRPWGQQDPQDTQGQDGTYPHGGEPGQGYDQGVGHDPGNGHDPGHGHGHGAERGQGFPPGQGHGHGRPEDTGTAASGYPAEPGTRGAHAPEGPPAGPLPHEADPGQATQLPHGAGPGEHAAPRHAAEPTTPGHAPGQSGFAAPGADAHGFTDVPSAPSGAAADGPDRAETAGHGPDGSGLADHGAPSAEFTGHGPESPGFAGRAGESSDSAGHAGEASGFAGQGQEPADFASHTREPSGLAGHEQGPSGYAGHEAAAGFPGHAPERTGAPGPAPEQPDLSGHGPAGEPTGDGPGRSGVPGHEVEQPGLPGHGPSQPGVPAHGPARPATEPEAAQPYAGHPGQTPGEAPEGSGPAAERDADAVGAAQAAQEASEPVGGPGEAPEAAEGADDAPGAEEAVDGADGPAGSDAGPLPPEAESGPETGRESGPEARRESGPETAPDAGAETAEAPAADAPAADAPAADGEAPGEDPSATSQDAAAAPAAPQEEHPLASYVLRVNGAERPVTDAWIGESLLYVLRERLGLAGAKDGCSQGECGACNVQVDGRLVASCLVPAVTAAGSEVRTVEGLAEDGQPSDVQRALARCGAVQCGFCIPGMAMTVHDLLEGNPAPTELETRQALCGNLCRCSGYRGVVDAVKEVVAEREAHGASGDGDGDEPRIPHQAGPGAGGVNASAFGAPPHPHASEPHSPHPHSPQPHDQPYGQDGGQA